MSNYENFLLAAGAISSWLQLKIITEEEARFLLKKLAKKYDIKNKSIILENELISTLINESIHVRIDTK